MFHNTYNKIIGLVILAVSFWIKNYICIPNVTIIICTLVNIQ